MTYLMCWRNSLLDSHGSGRNNLSHYKEGLRWHENRPSKVSRHALLANVDPVEQFLSAGQQKAAACYCR